MALRINTNVASLNAQRNLTKSTNMLNKSLERLSSGLRINRAADDAAGLAISESMRSDIRALGQASRNAADGVSMVQLAEGALDEVSGILIRMRELAQQSGSGAMGDAERVFIDDEFQALGLEINRISDAAEFNGIELLTGTVGTSDILVGTNGTDIISVNLANDTDTTGLGINADVLTTAGAALTAMGTLDAAIDTVSGWRAEFGVTQNRLESSMRSIANSVENLSAANSRIRDVDIAAETSNMTSAQILQQAGVSVLAQANMSPQMALSLLQ